MNKGLVAKLLPHIIAVVIFLLVALIYCKPVLQGQVLQQADVTQWRRMAQNAFEYKEQFGRFPLWTNSMFSGMPAYQIVRESNAILSPGIFYYLFTLWLPKPISFFFLACVCFYFLSQVLRVNPYVGIIGGLAYAYATYNTVLIAEGHDTKMQSIALMPALIGAIILVYEKKYLWGAALTALFTTLLIGVNHPQIAYYTFIVAGFMTVGYAIRWVQQRELRHLAIAISIVLVTGIIGVLCNSSNIFTTAEYTKASIRGGSELADSTSNFTKTGLSEGYALDYSMYKTEPLVMMVPNIYGGSSGPIEEKVEDSKALQALQSMPPELANQLAGARTAYWGGIGGTAGPAYIGAIVCFLALTGFFVLGNKHKWWILATCVLTIVMSWGVYFEGFNSFLLHNLPLYNKFRAPSVLIVVPTLLFCMMAVMALDKITAEEKVKELWVHYRKGMLLTGGVFLLVLLMYFSADFASESDKQLLAQVSSMPAQVKTYVTSFLDALQEDRKDLFLSSMMRSLLFIAAVALILWLSFKNRLKSSLALFIVGVLAFVDVMAVDAKYLSEDNYKEETEYQANFTPTAADQQILQDTGYYRVFDLRQGIGTALTYGAATAYFHNSIGGYHPAKLSIYQDLIEHQLSRFPQSLPVVNMLNTKYIIQADETGKESVFTNPDALGAAWFVKGVRYENTPTEVMSSLSSFSPKDTAILFANDQSKVAYPATQDSAAAIKLVYNHNDEILYQSTSKTNGFAVFSEVFYDKGWKAYIDKKEAPILRTNYVLRGLSIPAGAHTIRFVFHPESYYSGGMIESVAGVIVFLLIFGALLMTIKRRKSDKEKHKNSSIKESVM